MLIVKLTGGLGNQMFQYAFYKRLRSKYTDVAVDKLSFERNHAHEETGLEEVFDNVHFDQARPRDIRRLADLKTGFLSKVRRNVLGRRRTHLHDSTVIYNDAVLRLKGDHYLDGYWQSRKYFEPVEAEVVHDFSFRPLADDRNQALASVISSQNSVAIHVRKGKDFQSRSRVNICGVDYYKEAIRRIESQVDAPVYYVFSDNFQWCRENLGTIDSHFVDWNAPTGKSGYVDMQLMSLCKHNIIANSSYSWWSAFLNAHPSKSVLAPVNWFNESTTNYAIEDILPPNWTAI